MVGLVCPRAVGREGLRYQKSVEPLSSTGTIKEFPKCWSLIQCWRVLKSKHELSREKIISVQPTPDLLRLLSLQNLPFNTQHLTLDISKVTTDQLLTNIHMVHMPRFLELYKFCDSSQLYLKLYAIKIPFIWSINNCLKRFFCQFSPSLDKKCRTVECGAERVTHD